MNYTTKLHLNKPEKAEQYNLDHWNDNSDIIDAYATQETTERQEADTLLQQGVNQAKQFSNMQGTAAISQGGTGQTTAQAALNALHGSVQTQSGITADDEVTYIKRTPADVQQGTSETIDVENVKFSNFARDSFESSRASNDSVFSNTKHGLVPKGTTQDPKKFLSENGQWLIPEGNVSRVTVDSARQVDIGVDTIIEVTALSAIQIIIVADCEIGTKLTVINSSDYTQTLYGDFNANSRAVASDSFITFIWLGDIWKIDSNAGGNGVAFVGTRAQYEVAKLIPEGQDGFIPSDSLVIITDEIDNIMGENQ